MTRSPKLLLLVLLPILLASTPFFPAVAADGQALDGLDGGRLGTADLEGGPVIVVVWASWSPRCRDIVPRVNTLRRTWSARARVVTVVFQEDDATVRRFLASQKLEAPVFLDTTGAFSKQHAVTTLPGLLVFANGEVTFRGKLPASPDPVLERALP